MVKIWEKYGAKFGPIMDQNWTKYSHEPTMGKIWSINWSYYGQNMDHVYIGANYGQNMDHKLGIKWAKQDHVYIVAKYGQNMAHKMGKIWARFGPNRDHGFSMYWVYGFVGCICDGYWSKCCIKY